jgi:hypothetical protein
LLFRPASYRLQQQVSLPPLTLRITKLANSIKISFPFSKIIF